MTERNDLLPEGRDVWTRQSRTERNDSLPEGRDVWTRQSRTERNDSLPEGRHVCTRQPRRERNSSLPEGTRVWTRQSRTERNDSLPEGIVNAINTIQLILQTMRKFQVKQDQWKQAKCTVCAEQWPIRTKIDIHTYVCIRCSRDNRQPKLF